MMFIAGGLVLAKWFTVEAPQLGLAADPPDRVADIVGDEQRAVAGDRDADRTALAWPRASMKPVSMSTGWPAGRPPANGTKTTL